MRDPDREGEPLDPSWIARFHADVREDARHERRLLIKSLVIGVAVALLTIVRWRFL
jgi:hypothetical protein